MEENTRYEIPYKQGNLSQNLSFTNRHLNSYLFEPHIENKNSKLSNTINSIGFGAFNHKGRINRKDILSSYNPQILHDTWIQLSNYIRKNYESGKGTIIKGFGTFTFFNPEYNLEGTTNQFQRDLKLRRPIFIVSNEFLDFLKPGQFTKKGGLIYYTQKKNNKVNLVRINYSEIAFSLNISKEECNEIIKNIIGEMADEIKKNKFVSRELPGIGIILIRGNIFGIKFYDEFNIDIYKKTEKLNLNRKNIHFYLETYKTDQSMGDLQNAEKSMNEIVPKHSPITHLSYGAERWLFNNLSIKPKDYDNLKETKKNYNKVENYDDNQLWKSQTFFRAPSHNKLLFRNKKFTNKIKENNFNEEKITLNNISRDILKAIVANKGQLIKELKFFDKRNNGLISKFEVAQAFKKCNIHPQLTIDKINDIIKIYIEGLDYIDYYKLLTLLIKEIKQILKHSSFCLDENNDNSLLSSFNSNFQFGPKRFKTIEPISNNISKISTLKRKFKFNKMNKDNKENIIENGSLDNDINFDNYNNNLKIKISEVEKEIMSIKLVFDEMMSHKKTYLTSVEMEKFLDNNNIINYNDFNQLLRIFGITYPKDKLFKILKFIKIEDPMKMSLNILSQKLNQCKISSSEMNNAELEDALNEILSDNKLNLKKILFNNRNNKELSQNDFVSLLHDKTIYSDNILSALFQKLSNKKTSISYDNFNKILNNNKNKGPNSFDDKFYVASCERILNKIKSLSITTNEYFNKLLSYNYLRSRNAIPKLDFILALQQEDFEPPFTEEQLSFIFDKMKTDNSGILERNEFKNAINKEHNALFKMQDIIKKEKLSLNDLAFRFNINYKDDKRRMNFWEFKTKMKNMNSYYTNEFIEGLYIELVGNLENTLNCKYLLDSLNVYQKGTFSKTNDDTFITNFINNIQSKVDYHTLKAAFEKEDNNYSGKISKNIFCSIINRFTQEFKDEDLMRFVRITHISDNITYEVKYIKFIDMIYFNEKLDSFLLCVNEINKMYLNEAKGNFNNLISIINGDENDNNYITTDKLFLFLKKKLDGRNVTENNSRDPITKTLICKLDLDSDGKVSVEDLRGILQRYTNTNFFKYENNSKSQHVNLFSSEELNDEEFKAIVRQIKENMKRKNITDVGLFKKLDENNDGFINNYEFNKNLVEIIDLNPAMKDKFFNYLDAYKNGMVDLDTFLLRFKEFKSFNTIIENNNEIENKILFNLSSFFLLHSKKLNECEIFSLIDKDSDGLISLDDFKYFVINELGISKNEFTDFQLERVMQSISLSKNKNIGLADIREYMNKSLSNDNANSYYVDLKETFKEINNLNLSKNKKNNDWIAQAIEKFGMFISEKYDNTTNFFNLFADKEQNKFKFENFSEFIENNYECFQGFNLSKDELLSIFSSLDSQKKNYLTLEDFKNKLELFDFYRKMHLDIKNFLHNNFPNQVDSFSYFLPYENAITNQENYKSNSNKFYTPNKYTKNIRNNNLNNTSKYFHYRNRSEIIGITRKQFFDGINNLFPGKYPIDTILKYTKKYFNISSNNNENVNNNENEQQLITFSQFTFVYYGIVCSDNDFIANKNRLKKISTTRSSITAKCLADFNNLHIKNNRGRIPYNHNLFRGEEEILGPHPINHLDHPMEFLAHEKLITPFDKDPLEKINRIIVSSPNQNYLEIIKDFMNQFKETNYFCNEFQFKNLIKKLNIGLTNIEIEDILNKSGKTYNGYVDMNQFYKYLIRTDKKINKSGQNISNILAEFKQLFYKYYSNPKLAFIFNDSDQSNRMDFVKFKSIITELYSKENKPIPNFAMLKNCYDYIDLRKDGLIDLVEWSNVFGNICGKLDLYKSIDNKNPINTLRKWEMSNNLLEVYKNIARNRKIITQLVKRFGYGYLIHEDHLINILKDTFPQYKFNYSQWKMIVEIGNKDARGFIDYETFIMIVENCSKREEMPRIK